MSPSEAQMDKAGKMLRLALDPAATEGEAENAAKKAVHVLRANGITFDSLCRDVLVTGSYPGAKDTLGFGKYCQRSLKLTHLGSK
jgi:hypothetical protein